MAMDGMERVLFTCREVDVYRIPPRSAAGGHKSGEWRVDDKIFTARCQVVAIGEALQVRLEDAQSGILFACCPVPRGQLRIAVEPAADSSRNFVLRLEDAETKRHAFVGINFAERPTAFDFSVALSDHEKQLQRAEALKQIGTSSDRAATAAKALPEAAALYQTQDLTLGAGATMRLEVKKKDESAAKPGTGFLSRLSSGTGSGPSGVLPPPPAPLGTQPWALAPPAAGGNAPAATPAPTPAPPDNAGWATFE